VRMTVGALRKWLDNYDISDDTEVWLEYPERYGTTTPVTMIRHHGEDDNDFIECLTLGWDKSAKRMFLYHHY